jgi:subtilase family serine protease
LAPQTSSGASTPSSPSSASDVTVTAASGDGGSHFAFGPFSGGIGGALDELICKSFHMPVYPTASPYVLSVGGTQWDSDDLYGPTCSRAKPCGWSSGGGGFAWAHAAPDYQSNTTPAYLASAAKIGKGTQPRASTFNAQGRGYPDLAALAEFGIPLCTAPTVAGMLSLINDARCAPVGSCSNTFVR